MLRVKSFAIGWAKRARFWLNDHGYDFHPVDYRCWTDQAALIGERDDVIIFDIGANVGSVGAQYRSLFPHCRLYCFEPQPEGVLEIQRRFPKDPNVSVHLSAVGSAPGKGRLHVTTSRDSSSLLSPAQNNLPASYAKVISTAEIREVEVITLDDFTRQRSIERIDICKMDIQGGEYAALEGAKGLLSTAKIPLIYLEVCFVPLYERHPLFGDVVKYLARYDYTLHLLYNVMINGRTGRMVYSDAIFVSPELYETSRRLLQKNWGGRIEAT
jgi:FkbM family methyltransferase